MTTANSEANHDCISRRNFPAYPPLSTNPSRTARLTLNLITPTYLPTYILAALADALIPVEHSLLLYDKLQGHGLETRITKVEGAGHGFVKRRPVDWPEGVDYWKHVIRESVDLAMAKL